MRHCSGACGMLLAVVVAACGNGGGIASGADAFVGASVRASFTSYEQRVLEGDAGDTIAYVDVFLDAPADRPAGVSFEIAPLFTDTATEGEDYTVLTQSPLLFPAGSTSQSIAVAIHGDTVFDGTERIQFHLRGQQPGTGADVHTIIVDSDECLGSGTFRICPNEPAGQSIVLDASIDTSYSGGPCAIPAPIDWIADGQSDACVVIASNVTVNSTRATGHRPLVIVAYDSITVNTLLDVASHSGEVVVNGSGGAGHGFVGPNMTCASTFRPPPDTGAGGAGGSFMTPGGNGGFHDAPTVAGGLPYPAVTAPTILRGGCRGQDTVTMDSYGYFRSNGGGAVYLLAGKSIILAPGSVINASGEGGYGGRNGSGGAGGGSGGMIALYAPVIAAANATLLANGGGGGEGAPSSAANGSDGSDPVIGMPFTPAAGGAGTLGGNGGAGAAQSAAPASGDLATGTVSAGGGGGGAGYIVSNGPLTGATVSPPASAY